MSEDCPNCHRRGFYRIVKTEDGKKRLKCRGCGEEWEIGVIV